MSDGRKTKLQEAVHLPKLKIAEADKPLTPVQAFLKRTAEVTQKDHEEFSEYLEEKRARDQQQDAPPAPASNSAFADQSAQRVEMGGRHRGGRRSGRGGSSGDYRPGRAVAWHHA